MSPPLVIRDATLWGDGRHASSKPSGEDSSDMLSTEIYGKTKIVKRKLDLGKKAKEIDYLSLKIRQVVTELGNPPHSCENGHLRSQCEALGNR